MFMSSLPESALFGIPTQPTALTVALVVSLAVAATAVVRLLDGWWARPHRGRAPPVRAPGAPQRRGVAAGQHAREP